MKFPNFPKKIYVKQEQDGDSSFLIASGDASDLVEQGVAVPAAEYALVQAGVVIETQVIVRGGSDPVPVRESELPETDATPPAATTDKKPRKPRSDAGQPRGPYKPREETAAPAAEGNANGAPSVVGNPVPAPAAAAPAPAAAPKELTLDDLKASMTLLGKKHGIEANFEQLKKFKVEKVSALPKESYAAFNEAVRKAAGVA